MDVSHFKNQLNEIIGEYEDGMARSQFSDGSDIFKGHHVAAMQSRCLSVVERIAGRTSTYFGDIERILQSASSNCGHLSSMVGVVKALSHDLEKGYMRSLEELIRADVFADFLQMAEYLVDCGYKDAGAVIAGSALEGHLRKIAAKNEIPVSTEERDKSAAMLNADIAKKGGYSKLDEKNVTAWLGLRNRAAHGQYDKYDEAQVSPDYSRRPRFGHERSVEGGGSRAEMDVRDSRPALPSPSTAGAA